jgi:hypothetical protein
MPSTTHFQFGDRVVHHGRPEWGVGVVTAVQAATHEGASCQRLTCRFERAGLKTLTTAVADIRPAEEASSPPAPGEEESSGWLDQIESRDLPDRMARLPEETRDPFTTLETRLRSTLELYRFSDQGGSLLDWAAMQTRLKDPMTRFNRHELEEFFRRFAQNRDEHLRSLLLEAKKKEPDAIARVAASATPEARSAMQRVYDHR